jgi:hypothetical protein
MEAGNGAAVHERDGMKINWGRRRFVYEES